MDRKYAKEIMPYSKKIIVIAGGSHGMGAGIAEYFSVLGAEVVITYTEQRAQAEATALRIRDAGHKRPTIYQFDPCNTKSCESLVRRTVRKYGHIDLLINCIGVAPVQPSDGLEDDQIDQLLAANIRGTLQLCKLAASHMPTGACILNICAARPQPLGEKQVLCAAAKAAVELMSQSFAYELGKQYGLRVNVISPGLMEGFFSSKEYPQLEPQYVEECALSRLVTVKDVAMTCAAVGSQLMGFTTGQVIRVDGGLFLTPKF